jgi:UrcA family protein
MVLSKAAIAQQIPVQNAPTTAEPSQTEEVIVTAPREVTRTRVGRSRIGAPIEEITVSLHVPINDLDLRKTQDDDMLNQRVRDAAADACGEIDSKFPLSSSPSQTRDCIRRTVRATNAQIAAAIARAGGRYGGAGQP